MKKIKLIWVFSIVGIIFLISACASPTKTEEINNDFSCGDSVEFTYKGETVVYGSVSGQNNTCWLDRNLGAFQVCTSSTDEKCYGDLFQWGRGDDGHQDRNSETTSNLSLTDKPGHSDFIINTPKPNSWHYPFSHLWQTNKKNINNPCPSGWRVPTNSELSSELTSWINNNNVGAYNSTLKWPSAGARSYDGTLINVGSNGYVWSSTLIFGNDGSIFVSLFTFSSSNASIISMPSVFGLSVRCILD